jgi:cell division protein FtsQ
MPVTAPADRRFLRAQVKPGRRHSPWPARLRVARNLLAALVLAAVAWRGGVALARSSVLQVNRIVITGNHRLSNGEVLALVDGLKGSNILGADLDAWRRRVMACPWVEDATLHRSLPSTVEIAVAERFPIAIGRIGDDLYLVDEGGAVIDEYGPRYGDLDLPILDGLGAVPGREADLDERRAHLAAKVLTAVHARPDVGRRISQLDVSDPHNAVVILDGDTARLRLGEENFLERLQSYFELAPTIRESVPQIDYVDLRFGERVFVGSQAQAAAVVSAARRPGGGVSNH